MTYKYIPPLDDVALSAIAAGNIPANEAIPALIDALREAWNALEIAEEHEEGMSDRLSDASKMLDDAKAVLRRQLDRQDATLEKLAAASDDALSCDIDEIYEDIDRADTLISEAGDLL